MIACMDSEDFSLRQVHQEQNNLFWIRALWDKSAHADSKSFKITSKIFLKKHKTFTFMELIPQEKKNPCF